MSNTSVMDFVRALKSDPALKARVVKAQREAMANIHREADAIVAVARKEGFDLSDWAKRPSDGSLDKASAEDCWLTCCVAATSTKE
jgi:hypothetical protein